MKIHFSIAFLFVGTIHVRGFSPPKPSACPFKNTASFGLGSAVETVPTTTLLARLGGKDLERFFADQNKEYLMGHQRKLLPQLFTNSFPGNISELMVAKHGRLINDLRLDELHFDMVATHLVASLTEAGAEQENVDKAISILSPIRIVFEQAAKKNNPWEGTLGRLRRF